MITRDYLGDMEEYYILSGDIVFPDSKSTTYPSCKIKLPRFYTDIRK